LVENASGNVSPDRPASVNEFVEWQGRAVALRAAVSSLDVQIKDLRARLKRAEELVEHERTLARLIALDRLAEALANSELLERERIDRRLRASAKTLVGVRAKLVSTRREFLDTFSTIAPGVRSLELSFTRNRPQLEAEIADLLAELRAKGAELSAVRVSWSDNHHADRSAIDNEHFQFTRLATDEAVNLARRIVASVGAETEEVEEAEAA
jgi:hypothetical protein